MVHCIGRVEDSEVLQAPCAASPLRACWRYGLVRECPNLSRIGVSGLVEERFSVGTVIAILGKSWKKHVQVDSEEEKTLFLL